MANLKQSNREKLLALFEAIEEGDEWKCQSLLIKVDDIKKKIKGKTVLQFAVVLGHKNIMKEILRRHRNFNEKTEREETVLHLAIFHRHVDIIEWLLDERPTLIHCVNSLGLTPLHYAVDCKTYNKFCDFRQKNQLLTDSLRMTEMLLKKGASVDARDNKGRTPLHYAAGIDAFKPEIIRCLLDHGADVNATCKDDCTPIFYTTHGYILWWLLGRGANINYVSKSRFTLLSHAIQEANGPMMEILLENGADLRCRDSSEATIVERPFKWDIKCLEAMLNFEDLRIDVTPAIRNHLTMNMIEFYHMNNLISIISKMKATGKITITAKDLELYLPPEVRESFRKKFTQCEMEIIKMKERKIDNLGLSLFEILVMPISKLINYGETKELVNLRESQEIKRQFPSYGKMLKNHIEKAIKRKDLIDDSAQGFGYLIFRVFEIELPDSVLYKIVSELTTLDITYLAQVFIEDDSRSSEDSF